MSRDTGDTCDQPVAGDPGHRHPKSQLISADGITMRTCQHEIESEACAVAVALIVPYRTVFDHIKAGGPIETIPSPVPLSAECRVYRTKVSGMWPTAQARLRARHAGMANA
jgi:hypothetical protein